MKTLFFCNIVYTARMKTRKVKNRTQDLNFLFNSLIEQRIYNKWKSIYRTLNGSLNIQLWENCGIHHLSTIPEEKKLKFSIIVVTL